MAWTTMICRALCFALVSASESVDQPALDAIDQATLDVIQDDEGECQNVIEGHEEQCALSLRQLRARKRDMEVAEGRDVIGNEASNETKEEEAEDYQMAAEVYTKSQADYSDEEDASDLNSTDLGSGYYHHHHHHHHGNTMYLYHQTSSAAGHAILRGGFRRGHCGWCGGGIYFATSPAATYGKAKGLDSHQGFMIRALVNLGHVKYMPAYCTSPTWCKGAIIPSCVDRSFNPSTLYSEGYNSISFTPWDGTNSREYVIYNTDRVISMQQWHM